jgi:hypothetical protein
MNSRDKGFILEFKRHSGMSKKRKSYFDNMSMFSFCRPILLMSMWTRYMMSGTNALEKGVQALILPTKGVQALILPTPVSLHGNDFPIKQTFNKVLKIMKTLENLIFVSKEKNPRK